MTDLRSELERVIAEMLKETDNGTANNNRTPCTDFHPSYETRDWDDPCGNCRWPEVDHKIRQWADHLSAILQRSPQEGQGRPKVICLCGSTRFIEQFATATWELERGENAIVLGCTLLPMWYCGVASHLGEATGTKEECDNHHKRKIDLADEVLVLDIGGYIGESTRSEIEYATRLCKPIRYVSQEPGLLLRILPPLADPLQRSPQQEEKKNEKT